MATSPKTGPLQLPPPPPWVPWGQLAPRLRGATLTADWLPAGLWPELDALCAEQRRLHAQVGAELDALAELDAKHVREDREHNEALREAHRQGRPGSVTDERTPTEEREAARVAALERLWAGVEVFAEHADRVVAAFREHEDEWLGDLRSRRSAAEDKRRQAEELLRQARVEEFRIHRLGSWVQQTADDLAFGRQPVPDVTQVPARVSPEVLRDSLERPWHQAREWSKSSRGEDDAPVDADRDGVGVIA